jgi:Membrane domain of glycerophosphoryl diester phosphodiesterase
MAELLLRPLSVGEIIDQALAIYRRQFVPLVTITLGANAIPLVLTVYLMTSGGMLNRPALAVGVFLLSLALGALATVATVFLVSETYLGNSISAGDAFQRATRFIWRIILLTMMIGLVVGLTFIVLIVPGALTGSPVLIALGGLAAFVGAIMIAVGLILSTPALVIEDSPAATALNRSWHLTKGFRWKMFGLMIVVAIIILIPSMAISFLSGGMDFENLGEISTSRLVWEAVGQLITTLIYPLLYCAITIAYYDLRVRKEGFDLELLESTLAHATTRGASDLGDIPKPGAF